MSASTLLLHFIRDSWYAILPFFGILHVLHNRHRKGLNKIPGPWLRSVSVLPRLLSVYNGMSHEDDLELHRKYGAIVRIAPNSLTVSDPSAINCIYGIGTKFIKSPFYKLSEAHDEEGLIPDPFILTDKDIHTRMKRNAANAYSLNSLVLMEPWIEPVTDRLIKRLEYHAERDEAIDLGQNIANYTMDAVFALTFGRDFDYMSHGDVLGILKVIKIASWYMAVFGQIAWSHKYLLSNPLVAAWMFRDVSSSGEDDMVQVANAEVEKARRMSSEKERSLTFVQRLVMNQKSNPKQVSDRDIMTHALGNITAGSDTTATALRSILYQILKNRDVYNKLCTEVRGELSLPVPFAQANALPYLAAVIKEGMRMHPSVGMMLARTVPPEGAVICGYEVQGGVEVGINPWIIQRDAAVFPEPDRFWPDRWLPSVSSEEQLKTMNRSFLTFGHGAHTCSGRWISTMEMTKLIPTLLLHFDAELTDGGRSYTFKNWWFMLQEGLLVKFTRRI